MVPLSNYAFSLLVFLCVTELSFQGCDDYMENYTEFVGVKFQQHIYVRLEGHQRIQNGSDLQRQSFFRDILHEWCCQTGFNQSHPCFVYRSCYPQNPHTCRNKSDPPLQAVALFSPHHLYCMMAKFKNMSKGTECKDKETVYICTPESPETTPMPLRHKETAAEATNPSTTKTTTTATTITTKTSMPTATVPRQADPQGSTQERWTDCCVAVPVLAVLLIVTNVAWAFHYFSRRKSSWRARFSKVPRGSGPRSRTKPKPDQTLFSL